MITFYLVCFTLGLLLTLLSALGAFTHLHIGDVHHLHSVHGTGHAHLAHSGTHGRRASMSPVNGFTLAAFLCWFGGCGYLLARSHDFGMWVVLSLAMITGIIGGALLFWFLLRVLIPHERELTAADTDILGVLGLVTGSIRESGTGEIQFSQNGARRFAPARNETGVALPRGAEVVVMRYEQGIAYVRPWDELSGEVSSEGQEALSSASCRNFNPSNPDGKDRAL